MFDFAETRFLHVMAAREFDIIVFGATGCTGSFVVEELANSVKSTGLRWAVAGRNAQKLQDTIHIVQGYLGEGIDILQTTIIETDVQDHTSVSDMCKRARLILNCVGPYNLYGEVVVSECIKNGTHHVDLSAEVKYLETIQANYFKEAEEKNVYIIEACGFGSLPVDYGISLLKEEFSGDLNSVEYFIEIGVGPEGRVTNAGTLFSVLYSIKDLLKVKEFDHLLETAVFKKKPVSNNFKLPKRYPFFYISDRNGWFVDYSLFGPDARVVRRSQKFCYEYFNERPIQSHGYFKMYSFRRALLLSFLMTVLFFMSWFSLGRSLLAKYPSFLTAGEFSNSGPTRKQILEGSTTITLYGKGWTHKLAEPSEQHSTIPNKQMKLTISGPEIAYVLTAKCMVQAGLVILQEKEKLPLNGGVLTPGAAFRKTSLRERLESRGVAFKFEELK